MAASMISLFTCLLVGAVLAQPENVADSEILKILENILGDDDVSSLTTQGIEGEGRQKRSVLYGRGGCGVHPSANVNFLGCFNTGRSYVQQDHVYQNYYRNGDWGSCQNYFRALPLTNISPVGTTGYVGHISTTTRSYTVNACQGCHRGYPGISIRCDNAPYSHLTRQFVFNNGVNGGYNGVHGGYNGVHGGYNGVHGGYGRGYHGNGCVGSWC